MRKRIPCDFSPIIYKARATGHIKASACDRMIGHEHGAFFCARLLAPEDVPVNINRIGWIRRHTSRKEKEHMDYEEFKNEFIDAVKEKLARQGSDMNGRHA